MSSYSYSDPSRKDLKPIITYARSPSNSSSARVMYSSTPSSSRLSTSGYYQPSSGYHRPSSSYHQAFTGANTGYHSRPSYSNTPGEHRYRVSSNDAKYVTGTVRETSSGKLVEVIHQSDRQARYEPAEPRSSQATSSEIRGVRDPRYYDYGRSYTPKH